MHVDGQQIIALGILAAAAFAVEKPKTASSPLMRIQTKPPLQIQTKPPCICGGRRVTGVRPRPERRGWKRAVSRLRGLGTVAFARILRPRRRAARNFPAPPFRAGIILVLLCAGCAPHPALPPRETPNPKLSLALDMTPKPATSLDPTTFTVNMTDAAGKPVSGAVATVDLVMPEMAMGKNEAALRETHAGTYTGTGRFTMAGAWRATITASHGAEKAVQSFSLQVR